MPQSSEVLSQAADLLRASKTKEARTLLSGYLKKNPHSEAAWWLMSFAVTDRDQKISCLKRVLRLNPNHIKAQKKLDQLTGAAKPQKAPVANASVRQPSSKGLPIKAIAILGGFGLMMVILIAIFAYQFFASPADIPEVAVLPQSVEEISTPTLNAILPPTWTHTPTSPPQATRTPLPRTEIPLATETPTPDPNATNTPIPERKIGTSVGQYPPDFTLVNSITGEEISLSDYAGQPVLVLFFTTWCPSCEKEMPGVQEVFEKYADQGFVVLGVGLGASGTALRTYAGRFGTNFPMLSDWDQDVGDDYKVRYIPTNFFIRKNGKIWQSSVGMMSAEELDIAISDILKVP
jgi:peroxiredoxin